MSRLSLLSVCVCCDPRPKKHYETMTTTRDFGFAPRPKRPEDLRSKGKKIVPGREEAKMALDLYGLSLPPLPRPFFSTQRNILIFFIPASIISRRSSFFIFFLFRDILKTKKKTKAVGVFDATSVFNKKKGKIGNLKKIIFSLLFLSFPSQFRTRTVLLSLPPPPFQGTTQKYCGRIIFPLSFSFLMMKC